MSSLKHVPVEPLFLIQKFIDLLNPRVGFIRMWNGENMVFCSRFDQKRPRGDQGNEIRHLGMLQQRRMCSLRYRKPL